MKSSIPSGAQVKSFLTPLGRSGLKTLSALSGVPYSTLRNICYHDGDPNPGIDTVRKFLPYIGKVARAS